MGTATPAKSHGMSRAARSKSRARRSASALQGPEDWDRWCQHLRSRRSPRSLDRLIPGIESPILSWPLEDAWHGSDSERLVRLIERFCRESRVANAKLAEQLERWLEEAPVRPADPSVAIESLAWCHALPRLAQLLTAAPWCQLLDQLRLLIEQAAALEVDGNPLTQQILAGELPLTLAFTLPELPEASGLQQAASRTLSLAVVDLLDGEGLPSAGHFQWARPLLACWTRCGFIARRMKEVVFDDAAWIQLEWFILQSLRMARTNGSQVLSTGPAGSHCAPLFDAALALAGDRTDRRVARLILPRQTRANSDAKAKKLPSPSVHSEWAAAAVFRRSWSRSAEQLAVTYHDRQLGWELNTANAAMILGGGNPEYSVGGKILQPISDWEEVCCISNEDVGYLEVEQRLDGERRVQRQMLLARADRFLLVADVLLGDVEQEIEYRHSLSLGAGIQFQPASDTREGYLVGKRRLATVIPPALPEWRATGNAGSLEATDDHLRLLQRTRARRLYSPLFFDLEPNRMQKPVTWRQLTVAQRLQIQPPDVAAGFRLRVGQHQWLIYRSVGPTGNRTLLGHNLSSEFLVGRFTPLGEVDNLLEIE